MTLRTYCTLLSYKLFLSLTTQDYGLHESRYFIITCTLCKLRKQLLSIQIHVAPQAMTYDQMKRLVGC